ncbi:tetratricopeptide repeat protein [Flavobacterium sp.]|uniref:tetratricopeptide repeat protein n=1 Tax=Flavobacterium sp. TaxID=239 RepID=UPI003D130039
MKKTLLFIVLLIVSRNFAQNNSKIAFQKSRYELAVSYYKKADFKKAIDLFYIASKIKPENEIGQESVKRVDTLKDLLRGNIMTQVLGTWKMMGDKPIWAVKQSNTDSQKDFDELVEVNQNEILFFEKNKKTQEKKLVKSEKLVFYNENSDALFSAIILSDGSIWNCIVNENSDELHVINIGKKGENGVETIDSNNIELFYARVK